MFKKTLMITGVLGLAVALGQSGGESPLSPGDSRVMRGFAITPVPLNLTGKNRALVGLGSYLVNAAGGCNDCHTNPPYAEGGNPHLGQPKQVNTAGYLAGGVAFGPFISRNLTPDQNGLPAGLTLDQFVHVMRTGEDIDKDPPQVPSPDKDLLQVMPWPVYQDLTDQDLKAIYEYLRAIPSR
ncbi:MAG: hypothetical protein IT158_10205 [Bryobacterales bacterium]|nr:hypothetical protein [Bryobacterales bacterium]